MEHARRSHTRSVPLSRPERGRLINIQTIFLKALNMRTTDFPKMGLFNECYSLYKPIGNELISSSRLKVLISIHCCPLEMDMQNLGNWTQKRPIQIDVSVQDRFNVITLLIFVVQCFAILIKSTVVTLIDDARRNNESLTCQMGRIRLVDHCKWAQYCFE